MRVSDADREKTVAVLRRHANDGRITLDEFSDGFAAAYVARTVGDLGSLTEDLPSVTDSAAPHPSPAQWWLRRWPVAPSPVMQRASPAWPDR